MATGSHPDYARAYLEELVTYQAYKENKLKEVSGITLNSITQQ